MLYVRLSFCARSLPHGKYARTRLTHPDFPFLSTNRTINLTPLSDRTEPARTASHHFRCTSYPVPNARRLIDPDPDPHANDDVTSVAEMTTLPSTTEAPRSNSMRTIKIWSPIEFAVLSQELTSPTHICTSAKTAAMSVVGAQPPNCLIFIGRVDAQI